MKSTTKTKKKKKDGRDWEAQDDVEKSKSYDEYDMGSKEEDDRGDSDGEGDDDDNEHTLLTRGCPRMKRNVSPQEQRYELKLSPITTSKRTSINIWSTLVGGGRGQQQDLEDTSSSNNTRGTTNGRVIKSLSEPPYMPMLSPEDSKDDLRHDYDDDEGDDFEEYDRIMMNDDLISSPTTKRRRKASRSGSSRSDGHGNGDGELDRNDKTGSLLLTKTNIHRMLLLHNK
mmetsp:Transcript_41872/g.100520  ORF Transcript_41872/g.100520 Transcript_41872/m.100520 type:complete len:228 (+) Transcript_41872:251-934(+)